MYSFFQSVEHRDVDHPSYQCATCRAPVVKKPFIVYALTDVTEIVLSCSDSEPIVSGSVNVPAEISRAWDILMPRFD